MAKLRIKTKKPWIGYPGSTLQQNYAEELTHGYLYWEIQDRDNFDVKFCELPNPKPYVTIDWTGDVAGTVASARAYPLGTRFRVYNHDLLPQKDALALASSLRQELLATEVTFKTDDQVARNVINTGGVSIVKEDLRSVDALVRLLREFYGEGSNLEEEDWTVIHDLVKGYLAVAAGSEEIVRNTKWSLRHLQFDNMFAYGEGNVINFDAMNGVLGIFGPNRAGKSSIPGTIMYSLFNSTDRGSIKNLHVINARKPYGYSKAIINVDGIDYVIERQTVKNENKKGHVNASTHLNVFKINESGEAEDLAGEDRKDTEKVVRKLIGNPEDFLLTSLSAQDEVKMFISQGSTKRRQVVSRFLDLDICDRIYSLANNDVNATKVLLRALPDRDWKKLDEQCTARLAECDRLIEEKDEQLVDFQDKLEQLRRRLAGHQDFTPVTKAQVDGQRSRVASLTRQVDDLRGQIDQGKEEITKNEEKSRTIADLLKENNLVDLKRRLDAFKTLESSVVALRHAHEKEATTLKQQERSLKILDEVPCGDSFPTCKFIKDAHINKGKLDGQRDRVTKALASLQKAEDALTVLKTENLADRVSKIERLQDLASKLSVATSTKHVELVKLESNLESLVSSLEPARSRLLELEEALKNEENAEVVALRSEIDEAQAATRRLDKEKMELATDRGRVRTIMDKHHGELTQREEVLQKMKTYELVANAFHRKGIPSVIVSSQLPTINAEVAKILHGIVDFTVELEPDDDSDSMEVYINYGDSRRIIELGSGMEKMISSIAIRVALINVSTLPKTDLFIIDEGFGALDDAGVEACNRLLSSLKRYFRTIIVITHVDGVKDAADQVLEITKHEKDARVVYNSGDGTDRGR